jgi:hypothetical protein
VGLLEAQKYGSTGGKSSQFSVVSFKFGKREEKRKPKNEIRKTEKGEAERWCHDPSTARPDAPEGGAEEKIEPLRSG